jgi:glycosyltransferase involved in cell wall biosynthesis
MDHNIVKNIKRTVWTSIKIFFFIVLVPFLSVYVLLVKKKREKIIWGPDALINHKYLSLAIKKIGYDSVTLVDGVPIINKREDFDLLTTEMPHNILRTNKRLQLLFSPIYAFMYVVKNASVIHLSYIGGYLGKTPIWKLEHIFYQLANIKIVVIPFGADYFILSKIPDLSLRHVLLMTNAWMAPYEETIQKKVMHWTKYADHICGGIPTEGLGRWDSLPVNLLSVSDDLIVDLKKKNNNNNKRNEVIIVHAPNHRGFKGTEYIINAIKQLQDEDYKIKFILLEKKQNTEVLKILREQADILVEQLIMGYGLNAIEGMASGVAVLTNLEGETYKFLRRYSYLNECPMLSTNPENIKENLKLLIENRELRVELGRLGIEFVKKYHSEKSAQYMYGKIYNQLLNGVDEDLINMYHPLKSEYNKKDYIKTPLTNSNYIKQ